MAEGTQYNDKIDVETCRRALRQARCTEGAPTSYELLRLASAIGRRYQRTWLLSDVEERIVIYQEALDASNHWRTSQRTAGHAACPEDWCTAPSCDSPSGIPLEVPSVR